ncbi:MULTISPECIES: hypothetical protein [Xanthomonas]|uniref:hypothetical protein n=1 Tax=Xanthomonas TaxID=338 RepID=UPI00177AC5F2|nr:hypothetical protein [Xanthomonas surreyensis]MBD7921484.1 hypothetical protein [Xanthomonas surreyensis]
MEVDAESPCRRWRANGWSEETIVVGADAAAMHADTAHARCDAVARGGHRGPPALRNAIARAGMRRACVAAPASTRLFDHAAMLHARLPEANFTSVALTLEAQA